MEPIHALCIGRQSLNWRGRPQHNWIIALVNHSKFWCVPKLCLSNSAFHQLFQRKIITKHQDYTNTYTELYSFDYLSAFLVKLKASILLSQCLLNLSTSSRYIPVSWVYVSLPDIHIFALNKWITRLFEEKRNCCEWAMSHLGFFLSPFKSRILVPGDLEAAISGGSGRDNMQLERW